MSRWNSSIDLKGKEVNGVYQKDPLEDKIRFDRALIISFVGSKKTFMEQMDGKTSLSSNATYFSALGENKPKLLLVSHSNVYTRYFQICCLDIFLLGQMIMKQ
jgi:hypothetical protein